MTVSRRDLFKLGGTAAVGLAAAGLGAGATRAQDAASALAQDDPVLHLVNRITWGATPDEVARARQLGYDAYLNEQLNPESLPDPAGDAVWQSKPLMGMDRDSLHRIQSNGGDYRLVRALAGGMVDLAARSRHQLKERMVDFWADHFNVLVGDDGTAADGIAYINQTIRPRALGNFRSLVLATAKAPAMLDYLDNDVNIAEDPNENYARELMELHTLGVDGGYTEQDVVAVARAFTGWTINNGTRDGFYFDPETHDTDAKIVLGHSLPAGRGIEDGLHVINILVNHPATAQFMSRKLCVRFVSDDPPQSLVDSTARVWRETDGEIRPVLRHLFTSQEFLNARGQKFRRPLEFFVGMVRALDLRISNEEQMLEMLAELSQFPYRWPPPNGYPDVSTAWLNTNGLLKRWNIAMRVVDESGSPAPELHVDLLRGTETAQTVGEYVNAVGQRIFGTKLTPQQAAPFVAYVGDGAGAEAAFTTPMRVQKGATLYGLMLASPLFQWR